LSGKIEEIVIPLQLQTYLSDIVDSKFGYRLGEPWKYSQETLGVVVPILRHGSCSPLYREPEREYVTMYEVLQDLGMKDTGRIDLVELQNRTNKAIFVRAGTIFSGSTQNRAAQHSGVYQPGKEEVLVRCVQQTHGIRGGAEMKFGDIAPMSVTMNLMSGNQSKVWESVRRYTGGSTDLESRVLSNSSPDIFTSRRGGQSSSRFTSHRLSRPLTQSNYDNITSSSFHSSSGTAPRSSPEIYDKGAGIQFTQTSAPIGAGTGGSRGSDDLLGHMQKMREGQAALDDMMQKVPLFDHQVGAIIFNPVGVIAIETFDHPKSWEAIKKEIIEKYGDKIMDKQAEHLFELKPEAILPALKKFIKGLEKNTEKTIRKDGFSETRVVLGEGIIGEYTIVKGQPVHVLLIRENGWGS
jgi:hypothetical protein